MNKKITKNPGSGIELRVTLSIEEFSPYVKQETERAVREVTLQGFRKGNAPRDLALQYVNQEKVFQAAAEKAVRESFVKVVQEENWRVLEEPKIDVDPEVKEGLSYTATFSVMPEVHLPNYAKIAKKVFAEKEEIKVEDKEIQDALAFLAESRSERVKVEREANDGDSVELLYSVFSPDRAITYFENKAERIILGKEELLPGFDKELLGKKEGDTVEFSTAAPEDHFEERIKNKAVLVAAKVSAVYEKKLPEVNDEFAKSLGGFEDLGALKKSISDGLFEEKDTRQKEKIRAKLLEEITKQSEVDVPLVLVDDMLEALFDDTKRFVLSHGKNWEEYLKSQNKTEDQIRDELRERARERVVSNLVIYQIAKNEDQSPSEEEVQEEARNIAGQFAGEKIDPQRLYNYAYSVLQSKKVFERLEALAK